MIDLDFKQNVKDNITDKVIDVVRHLAAFTASESLSDISKARNLINRLARHEICGQDSACEYGCMEISLPLWDVTLHIQRALTIDKYQDDDDE